MYYSSNREMSQESYIRKDELSGGWRWIRSVIKSHCLQEDGLFQGAVSATISVIITKIVRQRLLVIKTVAGKTL